MCSIARGHGPSKLFILSGPSGVGKNTVAERLLGAIGKEHLRRVITATTRKPRDFEVNGVDYYFLSHLEFVKKIETGEFLEYANVHGENYYGSPRVGVEKILALGINALLIIDTVGVEQILGQDNPFPIVTIFMAPKNLDELRHRIMARNSETEETITRRLWTAESEMGKVKMYDHVIISDSRDSDFLSIAEIYRMEVANG